MFYQSEGDGFTVAELIKILKELPNDALVFTTFDGADGVFTKCNCVDVTKIVLPETDEWLIDMNNFDEDAENGIPCVVF